MIQKQYCNTIINASLKINIMQMLFNRPFSNIYPKPSTLRGKIHKIETIVHTKRTLSTIATK
jgi:hypothetical protein